MDRSRDARTAEPRSRFPGGAPPIPPTALGVVAAFGLVSAVSWAVTALSSNSLMALLAGELLGATPVQHLAYFGLVAVMAVAMMLPSATPMVAALGAFAKQLYGVAESRLRVVLFAAAYLLAWSTAMAVAMVALQAFGLVGMMAPTVAVAPGLVLVAAGVYQFTSWKERCLSKCRTPFGFLLTNWRSSRWGALRMGLEHSYYCLGCCWLLMAVVFVTGAMSLLWMGVLSGLILAERLWSRGGTLAKVLGGGSVAAGGTLALAAILGAGLL